MTQGVSTDLWVPPCVDPPVLSLCHSDFMLSYLPATVRQCFKPQGKTPVLSLFIYGEHLNWFNTLANDTSVTVLIFTVEIFLSKFTSLGHWYCNITGSHVNFNKNLLLNAALAIHVSFDIWYYCFSLSFFFLP